MEIGDNTFINAGVGIAARQRVMIGANVKIGPRTSILDSTYHQLDVNDDPSSSRPVVIGNNVWIGTRCTILPGVTIGENSVVAAGSIVNKDVPKNVLVAGIPAKIIRELEIPEGWIRENDSRREKICWITCSISNIFPLINLIGSALYCAKEP